ncbi:hypothetical protein C7270_16915 [Burkholderia thailandensis]|nr:hypothetical protein [Burkholderia thailandensis]
MTPQRGGGAGVGLERSGQWVGDWRIEGSKDRKGGKAERRKGGKAERRKGGKAERRKGGPLTR